MKLYRFSSFVLVVALLLAILGSTVTSAKESPDEFSDVSQYEPEYKAVDYYRSAGVVVGYDDGTFGLNKNINRAEFLKIVMEAAGKEAGGENCYKDVKDEWFAPYVCEATKLEFVSGYSDGYFRPENEINFAEASRMIVNVFGVEISPTDKEEWFSKYVFALENVDAIPGDVNGFDKKITRGDMAEMAWRLEKDITYEVSNTYDGLLSGEAVSDRGGELMQFESCGELGSYLEQNAQSYSRNYYLEEDMGDVEIPMYTTEGTSSEAVKESSGEESSSVGATDVASDYSTTNVQVQGVDEADIVKNDGKYIYYLKNSVVKIIEAYPPAGLKEVSSVKFENSGFYPSEMYVDGDRLVVIGTSYNYTFEAYEYYDGMTSVYIFDVEDRADPKIVRQFDFQGDYLTSRKVDDTVYLVANKNFSYWTWESGNFKEDEILPLYKDSAEGSVEKLTTCGDVRYVPGVTDTTDYLIVASISVSDEEKPIEKEVVVGSGATVYSSKDNLYIAEPRYSWYYWYEDSNDTEETYVHKFGLDEGKLEYKGVGTVPGTPLNQFSMDESGEYFRIATTKSQWDETVSINNVYVLDGNLNVVGKVEGLAPGERIYSTRFMGDRLYMVTYVQMDPLFVIDLSDPTGPKVLGELKIPGVSNYLHPYDETHLIGFGLDSLGQDEIAELGWAWFQGIKISMFDVTDVNHPVELHSITIGDRGTTSDLLYNHKALLFDKDKGFMAFPITVAEIPQTVKDDPTIVDWVYGEYTYQGAYVYNVDVEDGFTLRGKITHYKDAEVGDAFDYYYYSAISKNIERILYIGDYFYTLSGAMVKVNGMKEVTEVKSVEFEW